MEICYSRQYCHYGARRKKMDAPAVRLLPVGGCALLLPPAVISAAVALSGKYYYQPVGLRPRAVAHPEDHLPERAIVGAVLPWGQVALVADLAGDDDLARPDGPTIGDQNIHDP